MRALARAVRWLCGVVTVALAACYFLSVPFYAGSGLGPHAAWRLEHGRLELRWGRDAGLGQSFFIDANSEGLKFRPEVHAWGWRGAFVRVPLWCLMLPPMSLWLALRLAQSQRFRRKRRESRVGGGECS